MPRDIIIDTDPGIDDAVAILLALASPELNVLGLVAVAGNVSLAVAERNARSIAALAGQPDVPVYAGCAAPLRRALRTAGARHGEGGLGALALPEPAASLRVEDGVDFLIEAVRRAPPQAVTWCALGPLTNIATALERAPDLAARLAGIVVMGGTSSPLGVVNPVAEFNFYTDPDAAAVVFASGAPIALVPLDLTRQVRNTRERVARLRGLGNRAGAAVAELLRPVPPLRRSQVLHDPCVIAYLVAPGLFRGRRVNVAIETAGELTLGMSVIDWRGVSGRAENALVLRTVDAAGFYALLTARLARLP